MLRKILPWLAIALLCAAIFPIAMGNWSRQTTVELSGTAWVVIVATFVLTVALSIWAYFRESSSRFGTAQLINLRERDRPGWLRRGLGASLGMGTLAALVSVFWIHGIVPHLTGEQIRRVGTVQRLTDSGAGSRWCTRFVVVQFDDYRSPARICTEEGWWTRTIMPEAASLHEGDLVVVTLNTTSLGVSADLAQ